MKYLNDEEVKLLNEMKDRCLNGGQYKDENAKKKFNMLCHLEDFAVQYYNLHEARNYYELEKENEELKRYIGFLETKCKEYEKHYDIEIQCRNSSNPMRYIIPNKTIEYDTEIIRIPERKFYVGCKDLSKIREKITQELDSKYS